MPLTVLVTRPAEQAGAWVQRLAARGVDAVALPLIGIVPVADGQPVDAAWHSLAGRSLVTFVSPNAALQFFARRPAGLGWPEGALAGSTGPGTSAALRKLGVASASIIEPPADSAQFDTEALWSVLQPLRDWRSASVLVVRGSGAEAPESPEPMAPSAHRDAGTGRTWLLETLRDAGASVDVLAAYQRGAPQWSESERKAARAAVAAPAQHLWLLSSSEAVSHLTPLAAQATGGSVDWATARAIATHPRIAESAARAGFGCVWQSAPTVDAVVRAVAASTSAAGLHAEPRTPPR